MVQPSRNASDVVKLTLSLVRRNLREIISAEAGANDGFGFPFLMLATYLIRHSNSEEVAAEVQAFEQEHGSSSTAHRLARAIGTLVARASEGGNSDLGRTGGGPGEALKNWALETWLYFVLMSVVYGAIVGFIMLWATRIASRRKWIDVESYLLVPTAIGLFAIGTCGMIGTDDLLACFTAGCVLNWDGAFLRECEKKHDEVNGTIDVILNLGGFAYIGMVMPWRDFQDPDGTGLTIPRLFGLGIMVILFRRLPAIFATYKLMPSCITNWKEALFMGYFGPIGIGAVFYVEVSNRMLLSTASWC
jgi:sodium/hydrogen antiporter